MFLYVVQVEYLFYLNTVIKLGLVEIPAFVTTIKDFLWKITGFGHHKKTLEMFAAVIKKYSEWKCLQVSEKYQVL